MLAADMAKIALWFALQASSGHGPHALAGLLPLLLPTCRVLAAEPWTS